MNTVIPRTLAMAATGVAMATAVVGALTELVRTLAAALAAVLVQALWGLGTPLAQAAPYTPTDDQAVVQRLPQRLDGAERAQRARLTQQPKQLPLALEVARRAIDRARQTGDPRELGAAQAALAPWWALAEPPPAVRLLRATVRQSQHAFDASMADLDALVRPDAAVPLPVQAQAGLTRATVLQVTGRLAEAQRACADLAGPRFAALGPALATAARACGAELRSLQGQPQQAEAELAALARAAPADAWLALLRAELAERRGDDAAAALRWREALASEPGIYARAAHADWLLDRGRDAEVLASITQADGEADALLLRRAIALHRLHDPQAGAAAAALQARLDAARRRGEGFHAREAARLALDVQGDARAALALARENWAQQQEPADALLLARAAVAAGDTAALEPVRQRVRAGWHDRRLAAIDRSLQP